MEYDCLGLTVSEFAVFGDVTEDCYCVTSFIPEIKEQPGNTLLAVGVPLKGIYNPDLAEVHGCS